MATKENTGLASFECGSGNTMEILFPTVINDVGKLAVIDKDGKRAKTLNAGEEYTYFVEEYLSEKASTIEEDKKNTHWICYVKDEKYYQSKTFKNKSKSEHHFEVKELSEKEDATKDFINQSTKKDKEQTIEDFEAIEKNAILSAEIGVGEIKYKDDKGAEQTRTTAYLKVKFSKFLDTYKIQIEANVDKIYSLSSAGDNVCSRTVKAKPEIAEIYWTTKDGERIEKTGYSEDIYMNVAWLGLQKKTIELEVYDQDEKPDHYVEKDSKDKIEWKNNKFKIDEEQRPFVRQFKVGDKKRYEEARKDEKADEKPTTSEELFYMMFPNQKPIQEDLELFVTVANAKEIKLEDVEKKYGDLTLTLTNNIVDVYFANTVNQNITSDAPMQTVFKKKKKVGEKNKKEDVKQHEKLEYAAIGQKVKLVAECDNINDKEVIFQIYEKQPLLTTDEFIEVIHDNKGVQEIKAQVKDGYAIAEIDLRPKDDSCFKDWLKILKIDGKPSDRKQTHFVVKVTEKDGLSSNDFYKEGFKMISTKWHEPVDDPQIAIYTQYGAENTFKNTFGMGRARLHTGLDIFAMEGTDTYACLDGTVYETQEWKRTSGKSGYGHTVTIQVSNPQELINRKRQYSKAYDDDIYNKPNFDINSEVFLLRYCHLQDISVRTGDKVKAGQKIGKTGISGVFDGTCDPHLHFNIYSDKRSDSYLTNPAFYVYWKEIDDLTDADKKTQTDRKDLYPNPDEMKKNANPSPKITIIDPKRIKID